MTALLNSALAHGYEAMRLAAEMPRGPFLTDFGGPARGYVMCRQCLYRGEGRLLIRRRAAGRHLRHHLRQPTPESK